MNHPEVSQAIAIARRVKERLEQALPGRVAEVRLFGSRARGDARPDSDLDVFVMVDYRDTPTNTAIHQAVCEVESEVGYAVAISPRIMSREHYQELLDRELLIALDIQRDGIPV